MESNDPLDLQMARNAVERASLLREISDDQERIKALDVADAQMKTKKVLRGALSGVGLEAYQNEYRDLVLNSKENSYAGRSDRTMEELNIFLKEVNPKFLCQGTRGEDVGSDYMLPSVTFRSEEALTDQDIRDIYLMSLIIQWEGVKTKILMNLPTYGWSLIFLDASGLSVIPAKYGNERNGEVPLVDAIRTIESTNAQEKAYDYDTINS